MVSGRSRNLRLLLCEFSPRFNAMPAASNKSPLNEGLEVRDGDAQAQSAFWFNMMHRMHNTYPSLDMQTPYPFTEDGWDKPSRVRMAMTTVKSVILGWPELV